MLKLNRTRRILYRRFSCKIQLRLKHRGFTFIHSKKNTVRVVHVQSTTCAFFCVWKTEQIHQYACDLCSTSSTAQSDQYLVFDCARACSLHKTISENRMRFNHFSHKRALCHFRASYKEVSSSCLHYATCTNAHEHTIGTEIRQPIQKSNALCTTT